MDKTEAVVVSVIVTAIAACVIWVAVAINNYGWRKDAVLYNKAEWVVSVGQPDQWRWKKD